MILYESSENSADKDIREAKNLDNSVQYIKKIILVKGFPRQI